MKSISIIFFIFLAFIKNAYGQLPTGKEANKCFAKCLVGQEYDVEKEVFVEFLGDKMIGGVEEYSIQTEANQTAWLEHKVKKDSVFYSFINGNKFHIVSDTSLVKNFKITSIELRTLRAESNTVEWREVFCDRDVTPFWAKVINQKLYELGFDCNSESAYISNRTKEALTIFQKNNHLPMGQLNVETMQKLGVKMK